MKRDEGLRIVGGDSSHARMTCARREQRGAALHQRRAPAFRAARRGAPPGSSGRAPPWCGDARDRDRWSRRAVRAARRADVRSSRRTLRCALMPSCIASRSRTGSPKYTTVLRPLTSTLRNLRKRPTSTQSSVNSSRHRLASLCGARPQKIATGNEIDVEVRDRRPPLRPAAPGSAARAAWRRAAQARGP